MNQKVSSSKWNQKKHLVLTRSRSGNIEKCHATLRAQCCFASQQRRSCRCDGVPWSTDLETGQLLSTRTWVILLRVSNTWSMKNATTPKDILQHRSLLLQSQQLLVGGLSSHRHGRYEHGQACSDLTRFAVWSQVNSHRV